MKKSSHITAFYLETLLLIVVFIAIILVLTQVFGLAQLQSADARELTDAVYLAGNAAEALAAAESPEALLALLDEAGTASFSDDSDAPVCIVARYGVDRESDAAGIYRVSVSWEPEETDKGMLVRSVILVTEGENENPVYQLETASFKPGVTP